MNFNVPFPVVMFDDTSNFVNLPFDMVHTCSGDTMVPVVSVLYYMGNSNSSSSVVLSAMSPIALAIIGGPLLA